MDVPEKCLRLPDLEKRLLRENMIPLIADLEARDFSKISLDPQVLAQVSELPKESYLSQSFLSALDKTIPKDIAELIIFEDNKLYEGTQPRNAYTVYARMHKTQSADI